MRVLDVIDTLAATGGAENRLADELGVAPDDVEHLVVRLFRNGDLDARLRDAGIAVEPLDLEAGRGSWSWPLAASRVHAIARRFEPDVVHTSLYHASLAGQLAARRLRVPVVSTIAGTLTTSVPRRERVMQRLAGVVARVTRARWRAVSNAAARSAIDVYGLDPERVEVIERGYRPRERPVADRARFGLPPGVPLVVCAGRQVPSKNHVHLVRAFARATGDVPDAVLALAGRLDAATPSIEAAIAEHGIGDRVHLLGHRDDLDVLLASADLFVLPSSTGEGFPGVLLEAIAMATPAVATDIAPHRELLMDGDLGVLADATDEVALARAIVTTLESPPAEAELDRRRCRALGAYSLERASGRLHDLLRRAASER